MSEEVEPASEISFSRVLPAFAEPGLFIISRILKESTEISSPFNANVSSSNCLKYSLVILRSTASLRLVESEKPYYLEFKSIKYA